MEDNYNIDDHLAESLKSFTVKPSPRSFDAMMQKLEQKKKRRRFLFFLFSGTGSMAALFILYFNGFLPSSSTVDSNVAEQRTSAPTKQEVNIVSAPTEEKKFKTSKTKREEQLINKTPIQNKTPFQNAETKKENGSAPSAITPHYKTPIEKTPNQEPLTNGTQNQPTRNESPSLPETKAPLAQIPEEPIKSNEQATTIVEVKSGFEPYYLETKQLFMKDSTVHELRPIVLDELALDYSPPLMEETKKIRWMLAINFDPQISRFALAENKNRLASYDSTLGAGFSENYLNNRKQFNKPFFTYSYGVKVGVSIRDRWELWAGLGFQRNKYVEVVSNHNPPSPSGPPVLMPNSLSGPSTASVTYTYFYYSAEARKNIQVQPFLKLNVGMGLRLTHLYSERISVSGNGYYFADGSFWNSLADWGCRVDFKAGLVHDFGARWQWRLNPGLFFSPTSVFKRDYVIAQRQYGIELETMLVFKFK